MRCARDCKLNFIKLIVYYAYCCLLFMLYKYSLVEKPKFLPYLVVRHSVVVEVAGGREALPADAALVRLLAAVDPPAIICLV